MGTWRQGDVIRSIRRFLKLGPPIQGDELVAEEEATEGAVVITQTCDLVRPPDKVPNVEVAALRRLDPVVAKDVRLRRRGGYAAVPGVGADFAADLGCLMTLRKEVLAGRQPIRGCPDQESADRFAEALSRRWSRFAFPDAVVDALRPLRERLRKKARSGTDDGWAADLTREILVEADFETPDALGPMTLHLVITEEASDRDRAELETIARGWVEGCRPNGRHPAVSVVKLSEVSVAEYEGWRRLELDFLSP